MTGLSGADIVGRLARRAAKIALRGDHDHPGVPRHAGPFREAAVLVPIVERPEGLTILLTKRTDHLADHAGQISFPGGRIEPEDRDPEHAALREAEEEIGLHPAKVRLVGRLDYYRTVTGFNITPVVGLVAPNHILTLDPYEVAAAFEVPLGFILDPANHVVQTRDLNGKQRSHYVLPYLDWYIWGATAGMLVNLAQALSETESV